MRITSKEKGFTLIETLIYAVLVAIIIGGILVAIYQIIQGASTLRTRIVAEEETNFIFRKIAWALAGAFDINSPGGGGTGTTLSVDKKNFPDNPIVFNLDSGNLTVKRGGGETTLLNNDNIIVSNVAFKHLPAGGDKPEGVKISVLVDDQPYETTIYLRK